MDLRAMRAAFRELHGRRLAGFATMLVLGDRPRAMALAAAALSRGAQRVLELRDAEHAATWLRAELVRHAGAATPPTTPVLESVLAALGATPSILRALAALDIRQRAALIASDIEHLSLGDVERIVGRRPGGAERLLARARTRFTAAFDELGVRRGEIARAVEMAAETAGDFDEGNR
jgi:hypothetical protein